MGVFDDIYESDSWTFGSGPGSLVSATEGYRKYIESFIRDNKVESVLDFGCGDWQFSKLIDWGKAQYNGVDLVQSVINNNTDKYGTENIHFEVIKPDVSKLKLPKADLLIVKDVLQHMTNENAIAFVEKVIPNYKFALITNCIEPSADINKPIKAGEFRPIDLRRQPFNAQGTVVYSFNGPRHISLQRPLIRYEWKKQVLFVNNSGQQR